MSDELDDMNDNFPLEALAALPGGDQIVDDGFSVRVIHKIAQRRRRKAVMVGLAGSIGSAIAGAQVTAVVSAMPAMAATNEATQSLLTAVSPETIATSALAGVVALIALIVPNRV